MLPNGVTFTTTPNGPTASTLRQAFAALTASADLHGLATGRYAHSAVAVDLELDLSPNAEFLGYAFTQFAMPVIARRGAPFDFAPAHNLRSPKCVLPLLASDGDRRMLIAPLTNPHEQIITLDGTTVRWGWHGDLDEVPDGFATTLGIYEGATISALFEQWASELRVASGVERRLRTASRLTSQLSYWTDNGAAYWYRTEPGKTLEDSVVTAVDDLRRRDIPVGSVELDSWFYRHETPREIAAFGYPTEVPPTGMMEWLPRPDAFEPEALLSPLEDICASLEMPLVLHSRHISPNSPYVDDTWWVDDLAAAPRDPSFFRRWFEDARRWGATCIEQDWMLLYWFGVRDIRRVPGRAIEWQRALNEHAEATDIDLLWCMATPADLIAAAQFDRVIAVRTSDDYRFTEDPALLWTWFLTVNRLVAPLGLWPFKDCFFSHPEPDPDDPISGDVHAEIEALLAAMSGGPVGIGDRIGRTDRDIVMRTCDDNGRLVQPDTPIGLIDDCLFGSPARGERLAWATAATSIDGATWTYVIALNTSASAVNMTDSIDLAEIDIDGPRHVYDWRAGTRSDSTAITTTRPTRDWALFVVCPAGSTEVGDVTKYVTVPSSTSRTTLHDSAPFRPAR